MASSSAQTRPKRERIQASSTRLASSLILTIPYQMPIDAAEFHATVYTIVRLIPEAHITSYGHIARLAGHPAHSRMVGAALKFLQDPTVPWWRVINSSGGISDRGDGGQAATRQAERLREEGVQVNEGQAGLGWKVSLARYGWFPESVDLDDED